MKDSGNLSTKSLNHKEMIVIAGSTTITSTTTGLTMMVSREEGEGGVTTECGAG